MSRTKTIQDSSPYSIPIQREKIFIDPQKRTNPIPILNLNLTQDSFNHKDTSICLAYFTEPPVQKTRGKPPFNVDDYVSKNHITLEEVLSRSLKNSDFILIGEMHHPVPSIGIEIGNALKKLKEESALRGEKLIVAIEENPKVQGAIDALDYSLPNEKLRKEIGNITKKMAANSGEVIIGAKRAGLEIICVDIFSTDNWEKDVSSTTRDIGMYLTIKDYVKPGVKIIFYGGAGHTAKTYVKGENLFRLGLILSDKYGKDRVTSFNYLDNFIGEVVKKEKPKGNSKLIVIPYDVRVLDVLGKINDRFTKDSYNYLIIDFCEPPK